MSDDLQQTIIDALSITNTDPVSMDREVRVRTAEEFNSAKTEDLISAFEKMSQDDLDDAQKELFRFMINARQNLEEYDEELWKRFGDYNGPQMVNIEVNFIRTTGAPKIWRFKPEHLFKLLNTDRKEWAQNWLVKLEHVPNNCMAVYYTDDDLTERFGFPFDLTILSQRPE